MKSHKNESRSTKLRFSAIAVVGSGFLGAFLGLVVGFSVGQQAPALPVEPEPRVKVSHPEPGNAPLLKMAVQAREAQNVPVDDV